MDRRLWIPAAFALSVAACDGGERVEGVELLEGNSPAHLGPVDDDLAAADPFDAQSTGPDDKYGWIPDDDGFGSTGADEGHCAPNPCKNDGDCYERINGFTCDCAPGFEGEICATEIDECDPDPCKHGGKCTDGVAEFICRCPEGWGGDTCAAEIDECAPNPCKHGGKCTDGFAEFTCACAAAWEGERCEFEVDECDPNPCKHGGKCTDGVGAFSCSCAEGWEGPTCEDVDPGCPLCG